MHRLAAVPSSGGRPNPSQSGECASDRSSGRIISSVINPFYAEMGRQLKAGHSVAVRAWYATPTWRTADHATACWSACRHGEPRRPNAPWKIPVGLSDTSALIVCPTQQPSSTQDAFVFASDRVIIDAERAYNAAIQHVAVQTETRFLIGSLNRLPRHTALRFAIVSK